MALPLKAQARQAAVFLLPLLEMHIGKSSKYANTLATPPKPPKSTAVSFLVEGRTAAGVAATAVRDFVA